MKLKGSVVVLFSKRTRRRIGDRERRGEWRERKEM